MMEYNDNNENLDIKQRAKQLVEEAGILKYTDKERFEQLFSNIHILETNRQLQEKQEIFPSSSENNEAFSENGHIFAGPEATPHTLIRELLRELSIKTNKRGTILYSGIMEDLKSGGEIELNNGLIEYLATKISGEGSNYHYISKTVFRELEEVMSEYAKESDILIKTLLKNESFIQKFIRKFSKIDTANDLLYGLYYLDYESVVQDVQEVKKRYSRYTIKEKIKNKIKYMLFPKKRKELLLPEGQESREQKWRKSQVAELKHDISSTIDITQQKDSELKRQEDNQSHIEFNNGEEH